MFESPYNKEVSLSHDELPPEFFKQLVDASENKERVGFLKNAYGERFPQMHESIEATAGMISFLEAQKEVASTKKEGGSVSGSAYINLTEYQFLFTHFIDDAQARPELLHYFWESGSAIAGKLNAQKQFEQAKQGLLTQVATLKVFKALGLNPKLSHPKEDAYNAIDLWTNESDAIQVKSSKENPVEIIETDTMSFPAVEMGNAFYSSKQFDNAQRLKAKVAAYGKQLHKHINAYLIEIPLSEVNAVTGEPSAALIQIISEKMNKNNNSDSAHEEPLPLKKYLDLQKEEMLSNENKWFAGEKLGHSPTNKEAEMYYVEHGGAEGFAKKHILKARIEKEGEDQKGTPS
ncbi:MAG: hypothetical protein WCW78_01110 [Candidatus Paceibacterota bacterium]|jgi:hypothetical protein